MILESDVSRSGPCCFQSGGSVDPMTHRTAAPTVRFEATLSTIDNSRILRLPEHASAKTAVARAGCCPGHPEWPALSDGSGIGQNWIKVVDELQHACGLRPGNMAILQIEPARDWPEPNVPQDLRAGSIQLTAAGR